MKSFYTQKKDPTIMLNFVAATDPAEENTMTFADSLRSNRPLPEERWLGSPRALPATGALAGRPRASRRRRVGGPALLLLGPFAAAGPLLGDAALHLLEVHDLAPLPCSYPFFVAKCLPSWPPSAEIRTAIAKFTDFLLFVTLELYVHQTLFCQ